MNMSYFDCIKEIESAIDYINIDLEYSGFEKLNEENQFDSLIINCIKEENRINKENNLNLNIGGMRCLSRLINENKHFPEIIKD